MRILGIDPGINNLGWAIIDGESRNPVHIDSGIFKPVGEEIADKLFSIFEFTVEIIDKYKPHSIALESVFVSKNPKSTLRLGEVRASVMIAGSSNNLKTVDFAPRRVKQAVTGAGNASKDKVADMVCAMLKLEKKGKFDRFDACAIALCGYHQARRPV